MQRRAQQTVGTLILFIAFILVAAVAAGVLLYTASDLQQKTLETGQETREGTGTLVSVVEIIGMDGSDQLIENLTAEVKLLGGSEAVRFDKALVGVHLDDDGATYTFSEGPGTSVNGEVGRYGVRYIKNASNHQFGTLQEGDVAHITIELPRPIVEGETFELYIYTDPGVSTYIDGKVPEIVYSQRVYLYPITAY